MARSANLVLRHLLLQHPNKLAAVLALGLLVALVGAMEIALRLRASAVLGEEYAAIPPATNDFSQAVDRDPRMGYRPRPSQVIHDTARRGEEVIYEASYTVDEAGRRVTPGSVTDPVAPQVAIFGCSFAFGLGVPDDETLTAHLAAALPGTRIVNHAAPGYGTQHLWLQLHDPAIEATLRGARGAAVYFFIDHHLDRLVGSPNLERSWRVALPWLSVEEGVVAHRGTFGIRERQMERAPWWLGSSRLYRSVEFRIRQLRVPSAKDNDLAMHTLFEAVMRESAARLAEFAPDMGFRVLVFPYTTMEPWVTARLKRNGIVLWDYRALDTEGNQLDDLWYRDGPGGDAGHPRALLHAMVARRMADDLRPLLVDIPVAEPVGTDPLGLAGDALVSE